MKNRITDTEFKYNFVFMYAHEEWWDYLFGPEIRKHPQVRINKYGFSANGFIQKLFRLHHSYSLNSKFNLPFKSIWFRKIYNQGFEKDLPLCFVYMGGNKIRFDGGFTEYVRKKSPLNRQVVYHADLISKKCDYDYSVIRNKVDLAITYDRDEAQKYGINHFCDVAFSKQVTQPQNPQYTQDVYFLGAAKERLPFLLELCKYLTDAGVRCKFLIAGVSPDNQVPQKGVEYTSGISYRENLKNVIESRCVLEVCQQGSSAMTLRTREALAYGRRLLTNRDVSAEPFFKEGQVLQFTDPQDIDTDMVKAYFDYKDFENTEDTSALVWLKYIQASLEEKERTSTTEDSN